ncbi:MAG: Basal-body rod modification protein FlgD [Deltaproteobacteria bacterium]|jgi:flagellar basal-body rod modification protein FlgD|nr:Basal-body rod modification protein FlgD [Deltaproteobacteria bacterium]
MITENNVNQALQYSATSLRNKAASNSEDGKKLGKQDFLNLLMTQMANQDPLNPLDSEGMMQQLASMGTVEQLQNLNSQTSKLMAIQQHIAKATAGSLLDKDVEVGAREIPLNNGETIPVSYKLDGSADRVMLLVQDSTGEMIREINLESRAQGVHQFSWDGRDNDGDLMPDGNYSYNVFARTDGGEEIGVTMTKSGQVSMVRFDGSEPLLKINGEWVSAKEMVGLGNKSKLRYQNAIPLPARTELNTRKTPVWSADGSGIKTD